MRIPIRDFKHQLSRLLLQSSSVHPHDEDQEDTLSQNPMVQIHINFFKRKRWIRSRTSSPVTICLNRVCSKFVQLVYRLTALKTSFYMSRVRRKEGPKTYSRIPRKSNLNSKILKPWQIGGVEQLSRSCRALMNLHYLFDFLNRLESFNTWSWNVIS